MSVKTVAQKARVKPGATIAVINRVPGVVEYLGLPKGVAFVKPADAQLVFLFVRTRADDVWAIAERLDMRPLGLVGIDDTWSAFRLRRAGQVQATRSLPPEGDL